MMLVRLGEVRLFIEAPDLRPPGKGPALSLTKLRITFYEPLRPAGVRVAFHMGNYPGVLAERL